MNEPRPEDVPSFTLAELVTQALAALRADWQAHVVWNIAWVGCAFLGCCGSVLFMAGGIAAIGGYAQADSGMTPAGIAIIYLVMLPMMLVLYCTHQAVTMVLVRARTRGTPLSMSEGTLGGLARAPALAGHVLLRTLSEFLPMSVFWGVIGAIVFAQGTPREPSDFAPALVVAIALAYLALVVTGFAYRAFIGLGFASVVAGSGPVAAFGESVRLLRGRRMQFVGLRVSVLAAWFLGYLTCMCPFFLSNATVSAGHANPALSLLTMPLVFAFYGVALFLLVLDAAVEACFHERLTRPLSAEAIAETFT
jgi:hypothetical protein